MSMDSVTVLLHRLGVAYVAIMNPVFRVRRSANGELLDMQPAADPQAARDGIDESWIHVELSPSADAKAVTEAAELLPNVLADARQVAVDTGALNAMLVGLPTRLTPTSRATSRVTTAATWRRCCAGWRPGTS